MRTFKIDTSQKDKTGKTVFRIKKAIELSQPAFEAAVKQVKAATETIERMSRVDLNKLKKKFTI